MIDFQFLCPVCGSKTAELKQSELSKTKKEKPRALKNPWVNLQELF
jgi:transcription initiation factor IIE alpha subunit